MTPSRSEAWKLLNEFTKSPSLIKHMIAVEAAMRAYAKKFNADQDWWGIVGLLHDFDYERYPDLKDHPFQGAEVLRSDLNGNFSKQRNLGLDKVKNACSPLEQAGNKLGKSTKKLQTATQIGQTRH